VPGANTSKIFREAPEDGGAINGLFQRFDEVLRASGFLAMSGQIVDATIVAAPKQRNTIEEKKAIREGAFQMAGSRNPCGSPRRTRMHAGPSNTQWSSRGKTHRSPRSISPFRHSIARIISPWTPLTG
jgi:hypothetical protein